MYGRMDGWMDRWIDGWIYIYDVIYIYIYIYIHIHTCEVVFANPASRIRLICVQDVVVPATSVQKLEEEVTLHQLVVWVCKWKFFT